MRTNNRGRYRIRKRNEHNVEIITTETNWKGAALHETQETQRQVTSVLSLQWCSLQCVTPFLFVLTKHVRVKTGHAVGA